MYGIINSGKKFHLSIHGINGHSVYHIPCNDIGIIVSDLHEQISDITQTHILEHEMVTEKLMNDYTVLPFRFLTVFNKREDIVNTLEKYYNEFVSNLKRLTNKVEYGIKIIWPGERIKALITEIHNSNKNESLLGNRPGTLHIKRKLKKHKIERDFQGKAGGYIELVSHYFSELVTEQKLSKLRSDNLLLSASYLIKKEHENLFKGRFYSLKADLCEFKFLFSGPWPPYNFTDLRINKR